MRKAPKVRVCLLLLCPVVCIHGNRRMIFLAKIPLKNMRTIQKEKGDAILR